MAYRSAANLLDLLGEPLRAVDLLRRGRSFVENDANLANDLAWRLATSEHDEVRNASEAIKLAQAAERMTDGRDGNVLDTLAAAYAEAGRFEDAVAVLTRALAIAIQTADEASVGPLRTRLELYESRRPFRE